MPPSPYAALQHAERLHAARPFLHLPAITAARYGMGERDWSYAEVREGADALAEAYRAAGCEPGMRVALMLDNRPEFFLHFFALNRLGVSVAPIHGEQDPGAIAHVLDHADIV
ncbi:MAG: ATP-dependent acyl-CoA ligase, partial [Alphaproteobacteria bacterium]